MIARVPPHAKDIEEHVLGVAMLENHRISDLMQIIKTPDVFYTPAHADIFAAMQKTYESGNKVDLLTVTDTLRKTCKLESIGGPYTLTTLTMNVVSGAHLETHSRILVEKYMKRRQIVIASNILEKAYDEGCDVFDTMDTALEDFYKAYEAKESANWVTAKQAAMSFMREREISIENKGVSGISTTFAKLDNENGGLKPGQLIILGARPSVGKSAIASEIAINTAKVYGPTGIINLEMLINEVFGRMVSQDSGVDYKVIERDETLDIGLLTQYVNKIGDLPIYFSPAVKLNIRDIWAAAETLKRKHGLKFLVVDYLQLVSETEADKRNREQAISKISRGLKLLAKHLEIPILALCQLNRESEKRAGGRPTMADLRESGSIEQDADIVMLLHRDWRVGVLNNADGTSTEYEADLLIPKWRNGAPCDLKLHFNPPTMKFTDTPPVFFSATKPVPYEVQGDNPRAGFNNGNNFNSKDWKQ